ncbi:hypothetical protein [Aureimonas sp. SA4125]|uniref:hypothetical protein n=1 Tax=Aureimonas sp. SA4125 TaxID=2826993 RepID=UPI001CC6A6E9|nr:hypothetical protein [Aureimonas sp. SA4125]
MPKIASPPLLVGENLSVALPRGMDRPTRRLDVPVGLRGRDIAYTRQVMSDRLRWLHPIREEKRSAGSISGSANATCR